MPSFQPMLYDRRRIQIVESKEQEKRAETNETTPAPTARPEIPKEKKKIVIPECPGSKDQRVGDYRNSKKLRDSCFSSFRWYRMHNRIRICTLS